MRAFMLIFKQFATASVVMAGSRRFCGSGDEPWDVVSTGSSQKVTVSRPSTL